MVKEQESFQLILHSGNARSLANEALGIVKEGNIQEANEKLDEAKKELLLAQKTHAQMLRELACEDNLVVDLLLIHAEDHVCGSQGMLDLAREVVEIYERFGKKNG